MKPRLKTLAALVAALPFAPAYAQQVASLDQVVVTATRQSQRVSDTLADVTVIDSEEIQNAGPAATITELLARQPGIEIDQNGGAGTLADVFIRGSNSNHVLLLVDGIRVSSVTTGAPTWAYIPLQQVDHIEIIRGPASSLYGSEAVGGVVQIFTKQGEGPFQPFAEAGYGTWNTTAASAGFSGAQNGWRYSFQMSDKRSDSFPAINNPANPAYNPANDGFHMSGSSGSLSYSPANGHEFGVNYLYSDGWNRYDSANGPGPASDDFTQKETLYGVNVYSRDRWTAAWTTTIRIGQSSDNSRNFDNGTPLPIGDGSFFHSTQTQYQWQNDIRLPIGTALLGIERDEQKLSSDNAYALTQRTINSYFAGWTGNLGNHMLQVNVRNDDNSQFGDKTTGVAAYGYRFSPAWRGNLSWGTAFRAPSFNDLYFPASPYGAGNPNLKPESSDNREVSLHYETSGQQASVTYYHNDVTNLIQWAPVSPGSWFWTPSNVAQATLSGWTFAYAGNFAAYRVTGSVDIQNPHDDVLEETIVNRAREIGKFGLARDFGSYDVGSEVLASGKRYNDTANTQVLGGYTTVNAYANYHLTKDWTLFARANNIFDKKYALLQDYATPGANVFVGVRYAPK